MAKKLSTYRLSEEVRQLLKKIAEQEKRSEANMLEILILAEAKRRKISID